FGGLCGAFYGRVPQGRAGYERVGGWTRADHQGGGAMASRFPRSSIGRRAARPDVSRRGRRLPTYDFAPLGGNCPPTAWRAWVGPRPITQGARHLCRAGFSRVWSQPRGTLGAVIGLARTGPNRSRTNARGPRGFSTVVACIHLGAWV